jgi:hypothetical protein
VPIQRIVHDGNAVSPAWWPARWPVYGHTSGK